MGICRCVGHAGLDLVRLEPGSARLGGVTYELEDERIRDSVGIRIVLVIRVGETHFADDDVR